LEYLDERIAGEAFLQLHQTSPENREVAPWYERRCGNRNMYEESSPKEGEDSAENQMSWEAEVAYARTYCLD
jgi:hypothetical protein